MAVRVSSLLALGAAALTLAQIRPGFQVLWMIRQELDRLRSRGAADKVKNAEEQIKEAMELPTQEADPVRPYRPLTSDFPQGRGILNRLLLDLQKTS